MIAVQFVPLDTWFFRDGTPFTAQSAPQEDVGSLFPPYPPTLVGALRAALARANGWDEAGRWPPELCEVLGDGPEDLGVLSFAGPFLLRDGQPLFQAPRHLLGASREVGGARRGSCGRAAPSPAIWGTCHCPNSRMWSGMPARSRRQTTCGSPHSA